MDANAFTASFCPTISDRVPGFTTFMTVFVKDPLRPKKLLMHKSEIRKLTGKLAEQGYTLVPVEVYLKGSLVKVEIALAKGKKLYDKRQDIAKKDMRREAERDFKVKNLY